MGLYVNPVTSFPVIPDKISEQPKPADNSDKLQGVNIEPKYMLDNDIFQKSSPKTLPPLNDDFDDMGERFHRAVKKAITQIRAEGIPLYNISSREMGVRVWENIKKDGW